MTASPASAIDAWVDREESDHLTTRPLQHLASTGAGEGDVCGVIIRVPLGLLRPNPHQPRQIFDPDELRELSQSLDSVGLLQPITVQPDGFGGWFIVAGERRTRAARMSGWDTIPAVVLEGAGYNSRDLAIAALVENLARVDLNPIEEGQAFSVLVQELGSAAAAAEAVGVDSQRVRFTVNLLTLPESVQRRVSSGVLSFSHARALLSVPQGEDREALADRAVSGGWSARKLEEVVAAGEWGNPRARRKTTRTPHTRGEVFADYVERLESALDSRVTIHPPRKGTIRIVVEAADIDDVARLTSLMAGNTTT